MWLGADTLSSEAGEKSSSSLTGVFLALTEAVLVHISWGSNRGLCLRMLNKIISTL